MHADSGFFSKQTFFDLVGLSNKKQIKSIAICLALKKHLGAAAVEMSIFDNGQHFKTQIIHIKKTIQNGGVKAMVSGHYKQSSEFSYGKISSLASHSFISLGHSKLLGSTSLNQKQYAAFIKTDFLEDVVDLVLVGNNSGDATHIQIFPTEGISLTD